MPTTQNIQLGVAATLAYSFFNTAQLVSAKMMHDGGWPSWHIMSLAYVLLLLPFAVTCYVLRVQAPSRAQVKWLVARPLMVGLGFVCASLALNISNAPGDVQALTSINVVAAAAVGRLVLQEKLLWVHSLALLASIGGALLISRPSFLFGGGVSNSSLFLAHALALAAGFARAMALICARKCGDVSPVVLGLSLNISAAITFALVPFTPLFELRSFDVCWAHPSSALGWLGFQAVVIFTSVIVGSVGSMLCPAAVSATVFTGSGMVFGYGAQVLLFGVVPDVLTILGSLLMLLAVAIMTAFRVQPTTGEAVEAAAPPKADVAADEPDDTESDVESLVSFVASEFAEVAAHTNAVRASLRLRRPEPQSVGASLSTIVRAVDAGANA